MESVIVAVALLAIVAVVGGVLLRQRAHAGGSAPPGLAVARPEETPHDASRLGGPAPTTSGVDAPDAITISPALVAAPPHPAAVENERRPIAALVQPDVEPARDAAVIDRLDAIERRLDALTRAVDRQRSDFEAALRELAARLEIRGAADEARGEAAREQLRADVLAVMAGMPPQRTDVASNRREVVCSDLYAHLARLEWSLAAIANPALLPGEPFAPPTELLPAALVWENWNDVGERAFALGDAFSVQRLHLSPPARQELERFVTSLRTVLTRSIYPNVQPGSSPDQQAAVLAALAEIAAALPRIREMLETELREERE